MKLPVIIAGALALSACQKSVDQRFEEMYRYQLKHDHASAAATAGAYKYRDSLPDSIKLQMIEGYEHVRAGREALGKDDAR